MRYIKNTASKNKKGFTMAEVLIVVAIMIILFAVGVPSVISIQRNLRQTELDTKAETIYMAVQTRLGELYTAGLQYKYDPALDSSIHKSIYEYPADYDPDSGAQMNKYSIYYVLSGDNNAAKEIVTSDVLDDDLLNGHWVIELIPYAYTETENAPRTLTAASVYAVYYSEDRADVSTEYVSDNGNYDRKFRVKSNRLKDNARLGYYGGSNLASTSATTTLSPSVTIDNGEKLTAQVVLKKPVTISEDLVFTFIIYDTEDNRYRFIYDEGKGYFTDEDGLRALDIDKIVTRNKVGQKITFDIVLDDLSSDETRFYNLFGDGSDHNSKGLYKDRELVCGTDFTLRVDVKCPANKTVDQTGTASDSDNSLFAYSADYTKGSSDSPSINDTAYITLGRHLQNLDESSHVTENVTKAAQKGDISFDEDSAWYEKYSEKYFNKLTDVYEPADGGRISVTTVPNFKPIINDHLAEYDGGGDIIAALAIDTSDAKDDNADNAGLFGLLGSSDITIKDTSLSGSHINGANAGAIVGKISAAKAGSSGSVTISGCQVYLSRDNGDIPNSMTGGDNVEAIRWIGGDIAGGLVGSNEGKLTITDSSASTVIGNQTISSSKVGRSSGTSGGLIGRNTGNTDITGSYADSYLYGLNAGGLIGESTGGNVSLASCYAAGFIGLSDPAAGSAANSGGNEASGSQTTSKAIGAGLVNGSAASVKNTYTIIACYTQGSDGGIDIEAGEVSADKNNGTYYSTAVSITETEKTFYFNAGSSDETNVSGTSPIDQMTTTELLDALGDSDHFKIDTTGTQPYKLMGQSLTTYTYPRLNLLTHYGDWETVFQSGALVYYEKYTDTADGQEYYGFDGAGVSVSLKSDGTVVGDGYGVVFKANDSMPDTVTLTFEDGTVQTIDPSKAEYIDVPVNENGSSVTYRIYPIDKAQVNPTSAIDGYYTRVKIEQSIDGSEPAYFDYNPHFARTVIDVLNADAAKVDVASVRDISIRTPRHLYNLSLYYDNGYRSAINARYNQERDIIYSSYDWVSFSNETGIVSAQEPIGADTSVSFDNTYNGGCYKISDISFVTDEGSFVAMFGYVGGSGRLNNIALVTDYDTSQDAVNYIVKRNEAAGANTTVYLGILAGYNEGNINNCAVAGYYLAGSDATIRGYANSNLFIGGIAGFNTGNITGSTADFPRLNVSLYRSTAYIGGAVGYNTGAVNNSYAIGHIECTAQGGEAFIAGFAGYNAGSVKNSYCAMAITSSGTGAATDGFAFNTGAVSDSYYLKAGNYQFVDGLYAYDLDTAVGSGVTPRTYAEFIDVNTSPASASYNHLNTNEENYPFRAVVTDVGGNRVHYGEWLIKPELGNLGIFYWEHEESGQNDGYKFTYIGKDQGISVYQSTLCESHDDGGIITEYGYGYYVEKGDEGNVSANWGDIAVGDSVNEGAKSNLEKQVSGYTFYPYTTRVASEGDYIYLSGSGINGTVTLNYGDNAYTYKVSPFFADAMALTESTAGVPDMMYITDYAGNTTNYAGTTPGNSDNQYEIRSDEQLQYINWNSNTKTTSEWLNYADYVSAGNKIPAKWSAFTYLGYVPGTTSGSQAKYYFNQTHDVNADMAVNSGTTEPGGIFTPIGSFCELNSSNSATVAAVYFNGTYNGNSYQIKNVEICSKSQGVGLFGIMISADIQNIILYSDKGNKIQTSSDSKYASDGTGNRNWYCMGGLAGVAAIGNSKTGGIATFKNCTVSGYVIRDNRNDCGYGGTNMGGFVGLTNVGISACSAVTDIQIQPGYSNGSRNIRCGGLAGNFRGATLENCYSGGSISSTTANSTNIHVGGLVGGWFMRTNGNLPNSSDGLFGALTAKPTVKNCYTYTDLSGCTGSSVKTICPVVSNVHGEGANNNASNYPTVTNCYYYTSSNVAYKNRTVDDNTNVIKVTYAQFSGKANLTSGAYNGKGILTALNAGASSGLWTTVTTTDAAGANIDGKYSFPGSDFALDGKNYPFPTVLTQIDLSFGNTVSTHYGRWPYEGPFWKEGTASMDILDNISEDGWAYETYILDLNGKDFSNITKDMFSFNHDGYAEIESVTDNGDGTCDVKVKALKTGTVQITFAASDTSGTAYDASFVLEITARLNVSSDPLQLTDFAEGDTANLTLSAVSKSYVKNSGTSGQTPGIGHDFSTDDKITWSVTASTEFDEDGDVGIDATTEKNVYTVTGYGLDASITAHASYDYHGIKITGTVLVPVEKPAKSGVVGLSDGTVFNQASVSESDNSVISGQNVEDFTTTYIGKQPDYTGMASYYIYGTVTGDKTVGLLGDEEADITCKVEDRWGNDITDIVNINIGEASELELTDSQEDDPLMRSRDITLTYDPSDAPYADVLEEEYVINISEEAPAALADDTEDSFAITEGSDDIPVEDSFPISNESADASENTDDITGATLYVTIKTEDASYMLTLEKVTITAGPTWNVNAKTASMDILANMTEDGYAYETYKIDLKGKSFEEITEDMFSFDQDGYAQVDSVTANDDGTCDVKVKALQPGTVVITFKASDTSGAAYSASFTLNITGNLTVSASPLQITDLADGDIQSLSLSAVSEVYDQNAGTGYDYSTDERLTWSVVASTDSKSDGDVGIDETSENVYTVTGYGYDASITVEATYDYNGLAITASMLEPVETCIKSGVIGLSDGRVFNQATVGESDDSAVNGEDVEDFGRTPIGKQPVYTGTAPYFIYETADGNRTIDVISGSAITADGEDDFALITARIEDGEGKDITDMTNIDISKVSDSDLLLTDPSDDDPAMRSIDIRLTYDPSKVMSDTVSAEGTGDPAADITGATLFVTVERGNASYMLTLHDVTLKALPSQKEEEASIAPDQTPVEKQASSDTAEQVTEEEQASSDTTEQVTEEEEASIAPDQTPVEEWTYWTVTIELNGGSIGDITADMFGFTQEGGVEVDSVTDNGDGTYDVRFKTLKTVTAEDTETSEAADVASFTLETSDR